MWTTEFEDESTIITILDDSGKEEDVVLEMTAEHVDIRQYNPHLGKYDLITMKPKMVYELIEAFSRPEGTFQTELQRDPQK